MLRFRSFRPFASVRLFSTQHKRVLTPNKIGSAELIKMEKDFAAHNYHPMPVVWERASGVHVWDPEGNRYFDFLSAYSATNQGHNHPKIVQALVAQAQKSALSSRAFYNDQFPRFARYLTSLFGYESMLPANSGVEAVEGALKIARKWGYEKKKISPDQALIISACGCFHGRTFGAISMSCDPEATDGFGPLLPGNIKVNYDDLSDLEAKLKVYGPRVAAFIVEPIQGEAGVYVPSPGYLKGVAELCKKYNVLFIADEIQTGIGRTGKLLASDYEGVRPDIVILGKALSGGLYPISAVLADKHIMDVLTPGTHGSTFGGNPLASAVGMAALEVLMEEKLTENAAALGEVFRTELKALNSPAIELVRGKGLLNAIVVSKTVGGGKSAWDLCLLLKSRGLLAKPTHHTIIRLAPPLCITRPQLDESIAILKKAISDFAVMDRNAIPGVSPLKATSHNPVLCKKCGKEV